MDTGGLVESSQSSLIVLAFIGVIGLDVPDVMLGQTINGSLDSLHAYKYILILRPTLSLTSKLYLLVSSWAQWRSWCELQHHSSLPAWA